MVETFCDILAVFKDRQKLASIWALKVPEHFKITADIVNMWSHRDNIPEWSWAGFAAAAAEMGRPEVTIQRLKDASYEVRRQRGPRQRSRPL